MNHVDSADILVIGSGLAGLLFAHNVVRNSKYNVTIVTKKEVSEANTKYAQGGIASVLSKDDNFSNHINDTIVAGDNLCRENQTDYYFQRMDVHEILYQDHTERNL